MPLLIIYMPKNAGKALMLRSIELPLLVVQDIEWPESEVAMANKDHDQTRGGRFLVGGQS
jgi:hypothetical protein